MFAFSKLTKRQVLMAAEFLDRHSDELGNNGCNDYTLPDVPAHREMVEEMLRWNVRRNPEPDPDELRVRTWGGKILTQDHFVASYLAAKLREYANSMPDDE